MNLAKRFIRGNWGKFTFSDLNSMLDALTALRSDVDDLKKSIKKFHKQPRLWFFAEITGNTPIPGMNRRWLYSWREVGWHANDWNFTPLKTITPRGYTGRSGNDTVEQENNSTIAGDPYALAAINGCEHKNSESDIVGPGVDTGSDSYASCNLELKPISTGVVVPIFTLHGVLSSLQITGDRSPVSYMFSLSNAHDKAPEP